MTKDPSPPQTGSSASSWSLFSSIHPSYALFGGSLPFYMRAYYLYYYNPIDSVVGEVAKENNTTATGWKEASVNVRRAVGGSVAGRALKLATLINIGSFGMLGAAIFFVGGWNSFNEFTTQTRQWAHSRLRKLDKYLDLEKIGGDKHMDSEKAKDDSQQNMSNNNQRV